MRSFVKIIVNKIEKIIRIISVVTFLSGVIISLRFIWESIDCYDFEALFIAIAIIIDSFILSIFMMGFSVIVQKLKESVNIQNEILRRFNLDEEEKLNASKINSENTD